MTFLLFDQVRLTVDIPASSRGADDTWPVPFIPAGTGGLVVEFEDTPAPLVEWMDAFGNHIDVVEVPVDHLELVARWKHVAGADDDPGPAAA